MKYSSDWDNLTHYLLLSGQRSWHEGVARGHYHGMRSTGGMHRLWSWPWGHHHQQHREINNSIGSRTTAAMSVEPTINCCVNIKPMNVSNTEENQINSRRRWWENSRHLADCRSGWNARTQSSDSLRPGTAGEKRRGGHERGKVNRLQIVMCNVWRGNSHVTL